MSIQKTRLDLLLVQKGLAETREKARALILVGHVMVDGTQADKAGRLVPQSCSIRVKEAPPYVSRGGLKLEAALEQFDVDVAGKVILDVGASTGGFTDCLLKHGAARVVTVDVGYGQLDFRLRQDARVTVLEKTNIRYLKPEDMGEDLHGAVIDVSFISLKLVVPPVSRLLKDDPFIIALIKPQFEVGKGKVGKGGVVRDQALHQEVIEDLKGFFEKEGWAVYGPIHSPILGPKGNREFLIYLRRQV